MRILIVEDEPTLQAQLAEVENAVGERRQRLRVAVEKGEGVTLGAGDRHRSRTRHGFDERFFHFRIDGLEAVEERL